MIAKLFFQAANIERKPQTIASIPASISAAAVIIVSLSR
jgi:hypothetical protein